MLIAVWGAAPGIGKSTLCAGLARWLAETGLRVDHFTEEDIMTRPQFADVAGHFRATGRVEPAALLAASCGFAQSVLAGRIDVVVADALVPFVPSLLAMGCSEQEVREFVAELTGRLAPVQPVLVFVDGDAGTALARASAREAPGWLQWYTGKLARYGVIPRPGNLAAALAYLDNERALTLAAARQAGWSVIIVGRATDLPPGQILRNAKRQLSHLMREPTLPPVKLPDMRGLERPWRGRSACSC